MVSATKGGDTDTFTLHQWLPAISTAPIYDADGNLKGDGRFVYNWDGENRLASVQSAPGGPPGSPVFIAAYEYDDAGRRVRKVVTVTTAAGDKVATDRRFLYDGWNLVAEVDGDGVLARTYTWGIDASGSWQGAGGVGGLLLVRQHRGANAGVSAVFYDHNGNVSALADMVSHALAASYEYDALAKSFRHRPSGPEQPNPIQHQISGFGDGLGLLRLSLLHAGAGKVVESDPSGEAGGINLYGFVGMAAHFLLIILDWTKYHQRPL